MRPCANISAQITFMLTPSQDFTTIGNFPSQRNSKRLADTTLRLGPRCCQGAITSQSSKERDSWLLRKRRARRMAIQAVGIL